MFKEVKEEMKAKLHQIGIINRKIEFIEEEKKKNQMEILKLKGT